MKYISLLGFLVLTFTISYIGSLYTMPAVQTWYQTIAKPAWNPPDWVFAPVWTTLYTLIAISGWIIWRKLPTEKFSEKVTSLIMMPYWIQLALNLTWSIVFFGLHNFAGGAFVILALLMAIYLNIRAFLPLSRPAAYMLVLYFLWVAYATSLNIAILVLN